MKPMTIKEVKQSFKNGNSIMVDELKDPYSLRAYFYRLARKGIICERGNSNNYIVYAINQQRT